MKRLTRIIRRWRQEHYRQQKIAEAYRTYDRNRALLDGGKYYGT